MVDAFKAIDEAVDVYKAEMEEIRELAIDAEPDRRDAIAKARER